jgi:hypothetical protein
MTVTVTIFVEIVVAIDEKEVATVSTNNWTLE